jgi:hypothetical protein
MREITVKMAKPSQEDFDAVYHLLQWIDAVFESDVYLTDDEDKEDPIGSDTETMYRLKKKWRSVGGSWQRMLWAGKTAIDNCCDPACDVLEYKPELRRAVAVEGALTGLMERWEERMKTSAGVVAHIGRCIDDLREVIKTAEEAAMEPPK